jgi:hypothetical protein
MAPENSNPGILLTYSIAIALIFLFLINTNGYGVLAQLPEPDKKLLLAVIRPQTDESTVAKAYSDSFTQHDFIELVRELDSKALDNLSLVLSTENKGISFFSLADIKANIQAVKDAGVKFVMFDIERSADFGTPWNEIADGTTHDSINPQKVVNTFKEASRIVHEAGLPFWSDAGFPFNRWDYKGFDYLTAFAPYVDGVKLQGMSKLQGSNGAQNYKDFIVESINRYKTANPNINTFFAQVTTNPEYADLQKMKDGTNAVLPYVSGMSSWYSDTTSQLSQLKSWVEWYHTNRMAETNTVSD